MSNNFDNGDDPILKAGGDLREPLVLDGPMETLLENLQPQPKNPLSAFVKPKIHVEQDASTLDETFTPEQVVALSKAIEAATRKKIAEATYNAHMEGQVLPKNVTPITDFSNLSMDSVYDLSIPIEAKEFMSADALTILLKDTNYEARWVNKNPQNLGSKIAKGFTYIEPRDLQDGIESAIQASKDAQGHFVFDDVVAMKIDKATYYRALRAAHLRAVATTNEVKARERAAKSANAYMQQSDVSADYNSASSARKMVFYDPGIGV